MPPNIPNLPRSASAAAIVLELSVYLDGIRLPAGDWSAGSEIDTLIIYTDYYYIEALLPSIQMLGTWIECIRETFRSTI